ncbi:MAG: single-strand DNA-binding protein [Actinomycetota bacterium]|jgi:single-strand DNA-binding protein|nr:single-strand DNA-binding protein [Actinomycetota bacterium]
MAEQVLDKACNEVVLVGRVSREPVEKELPSGDLLVQWSVIVDRPPTRRPVPEGGRQTTTDTIECVARTAGLRRTAGAFAPGDLVRVEGALRRRFWRGPTGLGSKYEIEAASAKRLVRAQASR